MKIRRPRQGVKVKYYSIVTMVRYLIFRIPVPTDALVGVDHVEPANLPISVPRSHGHVGIYPLTSKHKIQAGLRQSDDGYRRRLPWTPASALSSAFRVLPPGGQRGLSARTGQSPLDSHVAEVSPHGFDASQSASDCATRLSKIVNARRWWS